MNIYVGNLAYSVTEDSLRNLFEQYGQVNSVKIIKDKITGNSKGYAFVEMGSEAESQAAIDALNGKEFEGRTMTVNVARQREPREGGMRRPGGGNGGRPHRGGPRNFGGHSRFGRGE